MRYIIILLFLLAGCSTKTPTEAIVSEGVRLVDETIDYAEGNITENADTIFLMNALKSCRSSLISCDVSCGAEKDTLEANLSYWQLVCYSLLGLIGFLVYFLFRKK